MILLLYATLFAMWRRFWNVINIVLDAENILYNDELFTDTVDTAKQNVEQYRKTKYLNGAMSKEKGYLLDGKKQSVDKVSDRTIIKYMMNTSSMN